MFDMILNGGRGDFFVWILFLGEVRIVIKVMKNNKVVSFDGI